MNWIKLIVRISFSMRIDCIPFICVSIRWDGDLLYRLGLCIVSSAECVFLHDSQFRGKNIFNQNKLSNISWSMIGHLALMNWVKWENVKVKILFIHTSHTPTVFCSSFGVEDLLIFLDNDFKWNELKLLSSV